MSSIIASLPLVHPRREGGLSALIGRVVSSAAMQEVAQQIKHRPRRSRKLPAEATMLVVIAMNLLTAMALELVVEHLWIAAGWVLDEDPETPPTKSAIRQARERLGVRPIVALFHRCCRVLATPTTPGAFRFGLRLMALDSTIEEAPDTPENARAFGRYTNGSSASAFPQILGTYLVECGTHAIIDAVFGPCHGDPHAAARRVLRIVDAGMLLLWDCGFHSLTLLRRCLERELSFVGRVGSQVQYPAWEILPDGSYLAHLTGAPKPRSSRHERTGLIRVVHYTLTDPDRPGYQEDHRLVTSLLDPVTAPALDLVLAYHERWELEGVLDEIDTHLRPSHRPLRSKKPLGVLQELYGLLLAHYILRALMYEAACRRDLDLDRISFVRARTLLLTYVPILAVVPVASQCALYDRLVAAIAMRLVPPREDRTNLRVVKRQRSRYHRKSPGARCPPPHDRPFATAIAILPPAGHDRPNLN